MLRKQYDMTNYIVCDICSGDHSLASAAGGFLFCSKGVCPACAPKFEQSVLAYGEEHMILDRARAGETFREFIIRVRDGHNTATVTGDQNLIEITDRMWGGKP